MATDKKPATPALTPVQSAVQCLIMLLGIYGPLYEMYRRGLAALKAGCTHAYPDAVRGKPTLCVHCGGNRSYIAPSEPFRGWVPQSSVIAVDGRKYPPLTSAYAAFVADGKVPNVSMVAATQADVDARRAATVGQFIPSVGFVEAVAAAVGGKKRNLPDGLLAESRGMGSYSLAIRAKLPPREAKAAKGLASVADILSAPTVATTAPAPSAPLTRPAVKPDTMPDAVWGMLTPEQQTALSA